MQIWSRQFLRVECRFLNWKTCGNFSRQKALHLPLREPKVSSQAWRKSQKNLHRVVEFQQSNWLEAYIVKNTTMRKQASNDFEKTFYKLMSNACFGETMENFRRRGSMRFVTTEAQAETFVRRATFKNFKIISDALVSVSFSASSVVWNKPTPVEATLLGFSKLCLYRFYNEEMLPGYGSDRLKVVYKDTDSLLIQSKLRTYMQICQHLSIFLIFLIIPKIICFTTKPTRRFHLQWPMNWREKFWRKWFA